MSRKKQKPLILLTGEPASGKTTVIRKILALLGERAGGFYTREVCVNGERTGFEIVTLNGHVGELASKENHNKFQRAVRFHSYLVNLDAVDYVAVPALLNAMQMGKVVVVDEIGPMEIFSKSFQNAVLTLLDSDILAIGTIVQRQNDFADRVKSHPRVILKVVRKNNRDILPKSLYSMVEEFLNADKDS